MSRSRLWEVVAWLFIIGTVVFVQSGTFKNISNKPTNSGPDLSIHQFAKYSVGTKHLFAKNPESKKILSQLGETFIKLHPDGIQPSSIPVLVELSGRDTALRELERMSENPDIVRDAHDLPIFQKLYHDGSDALDSEQRLVLKHYGWMGELALSQDKPDTNPERQAVLKSASGMVVMVLLVMMAGLVCLLGGLTLLIISIVLLFKGKISTLLVMPENPGRSLLEAFAIYLVGYIVIPFLIVTIAPGFGKGATISQLFFIIFPILWLLIRGSRWKECRAALGWNFGRGLFREIGAGIVGCITGLPLVFCAFIVVVIVSRHTGIIPSHPAINQLGNNPILLLLLACVFAPVVEETLFRGALYGYLRRSFSWVVSGIISGLIFAAIHPQGWVAVPLLCTMGFIFATIREWRGSIIASMTAHSMMNGMTVIMVIAGM